MIFVSLFDQRWLSSHLHRQFQENKGKQDKQQQQQLSKFMHNLCMNSPRRFNEVVAELSLD